MKVIALVAALAVAGSVGAAPQIEMRVGATKFDHHGDNVWYQKDAGPYTLTLTSPSGYLGVTDTLGPVRWHAGARYLGRYSTECGCLSSDRAYETGNPAGWPLSHFSTRGEAFGPQATMSYAFGPVSLGAGIMFAGISNQVHVENWRPSLDFPDQGTRWGAAQTLDVAKTRVWKAVPVLTAAYTAGRASVTVSATRLPVLDPSYPIVKDWAVSVEAGWLF